MCFFVRETTGLQEISMFLLSPSCYNLIPIDICQFKLLLNLLHSSPRWLTLNTKALGPSLPSILQLRNLQREVVVEAGEEKELEVEAVEEWSLLEMGYRSKMLPK